MKSYIQRYIEQHGASQEGLNCPLETPEGQAAIEASIHFLNHSKSQAMLALDPYWPKWDAPWWHMLALTEIGAAERISTIAFDALLSSIEKHHLPFFPLEESQLPPGCDPYRQIMCFCALGSVLKMCAHANIDGFKSIPWAEEWFLTYLLPDGGYNCDEKAYTKAVPRSSFTSSLPMYEALLLLKKDQSSSKKILMGGADYLQHREFCKSLSQQRVADANWLRPGFPLFYEYDVLRGMQYVADVYQSYEEPFDLKPFHFAFMALYEQIMVTASVFRQPEDYGSFSLRYKEGHWDKGEASGFILLQWLKQPEIHQYYIRQRFKTLCESLLKSE